MESAEFEKNSLDLKHQFVLSEYNGVLLFLAGLGSGAFAITALLLKDWPLYAVLISVTAYAAWLEYGEPRREQLKQIQNQVKKLA